jgi:hypothetical protein
MGEFEIIQSEIPCSIYEKEIKSLIELLLELDEEIEE